MISDEMKKDIKKHGFAFPELGELFQLCIDDGEVGCFRPVKNLPPFVSISSKADHEGYRASSLLLESSALMLCTGLELAADDGTMNTCGHSCSFKVGHTTVFIEEATVVFYSADEAKCKQFIDRVRKFVSDLMKASEPSAWDKINMEDFA